MTPGDIVKTITGSHWRVLRTDGDIVWCEHVQTGVVAHHHRRHLTLTEPHPGGAGWRP